MPADQIGHADSEPEQADAARRQEPLHAADAAGRRLPAGAGSGRLRPGVQRAAEDAEGPDQPGALRDGGARHPLLPERHPVRRRRQEPDAGGHRRPPPGAGAGDARRRDPEAGSDPAAQDRARTAAPAARRRHARSRCASPATRPSSASAAWSSSPSWSKASSPTTTASSRRTTRTRVTLGRAPLLASLQRAAILTSEKFKGVRVNIEPGTLRIASSNAEQEEAKEELEIDYGGDAHRDRLQRHLPDRRAGQHERRRWSRSSCRTPTRAR